MDLLQVRGVKKSFASTEVLKGVQFSLRSAEQCVICGASGSGKSTLLYLMGGLDRPSHGQLLWEGRDLTTMKDDALADYRNRVVGFVFQFHYLLPSMTCWDNLLLPARIGGASLKNVRSHVAELAECLGVGGQLNKYPYTLSGGEQQRVNIVRALSLKPQLLFCDEPTGNLDAGNSEKVAGLLMGVAKENGSALVVVTHDRTLATRFSRKLTMIDGLLHENS